MWSILSATNGLGGIYFADSGANKIGMIDYNHSINAMSFQTNSGERMRFTSAGTAEFNTGGATDTNGEWCVKLKQDSDAGDNNMLVIANSSSSVMGSITSNSSNAAFNTSSDYRLKENETAITDGITRIKQLKPYKFNWKSNPSADKVDGFFAHEVSSAVPEAVVGTKDATETYTDENGDEQTRILPQGIDQSKLVPLLVAAIIELEARVKTLEDA